MNQELQDTKSMLSKMSGEVLAGRSFDQLRNLKAEWSKKDSTDLCFHISNLLATVKNFQPTSKEGTRTNLLISTILASTKAMVSKLSMVFEGDGSRRSLLTEAKQFKEIASRIASFPLENLVNAQPNMTVISDESKKFIKQHARLVSTASSLTEVFNIIQDIHDSFESGSQEGLISLYAKLESITSSDPDLLTKAGQDMVGKLKHQCSVQSIAGPRFEKALVELQHYVVSVLPNAVITDHYEPGDNTDEQVDDMKHTAMKLATWAAEGAVPARAKVSALGAMCIIARNVHILCQVGRAMDETQPGDDQKLDCLKEDLFPSSWPTVELKNALEQVTETDIGQMLDKMFGPGDTAAMVDGYFKVSRAHFVRGLDEAAASLLGDLSGHLHDVTELLARFNNTSSPAECAKLKTASDELTVKHKECLAKFRAWGLDYTSESIYSEATQAMESSDGLQVAWGMSLLLSEQKIFDEEKGVKLRAKMKVIYEAYDLHDPQSAVRKGGYLSEEAVEKAHKLMLMICPDKKAPSKPKVVSVGRVQAIENNIMHVKQKTI